MSTDDFSSSESTDPHSTNEIYETVMDDGDALKQAEDLRDDIRDAASGTKQGAEPTSAPIEASQAVEQGDPEWEDDPELAELAEPFIGRWNGLISTTNWEKGRIIHEWRETLIEQGAPATQFSDEAWSRRVGGVTSPHVGRLRRVYERFHDSYVSYEGIYWSHFLAALDWDDAPLWLEGASQESWSISAMREKRWQANGAVESQRPTGSQVVEVDLDEDVVLPAQGGGRERKYDDETDGIAVGPVPEGADFGDEPDYGSGEELASMSGRDSDGAAQVSEVPVQPFVGLPQLTDDFMESIESMKLSVLRHKSNGWNEVNVEDVERYLDALRILLRS